MTNASGETRPAAVRRQIAFFGAGLLILVIVLILIGVAVSRYQGSVGFRNLLSQIDVALEDSRLDSAEEFLLRGLGFVRSNRDGQRLSARLYRFRELGGNAQTVDRVGVELLDSLPGSQELRAFRVDHLLRTNRVSDAAEVARGLEDATWLPLKIEANLKARIPLSEELRMLDLPGVALPIPVEQYPEPNSFLEAWTLTRDIRYLVDAALLLAARGQIEDAVDLLLPRQHELQSQAEIELLMLLEFDAFGSERAIRRASQIDTRTAAFYRLLADMYVEQGDFAPAAEVLEVLVSDTTVEARDFSNLVALRLALNAEGRALEAAQRGLRQFPSDVQLQISHAALLGDEDVLDRYRSQSPSEGRLALAGALMSTEFRGFSHLLTLLWSLNKEETGESSIQKVLAWVLWHLDDHEGLQELLADIDPLRRPWTRQFRALLALRRGDEEAALAEMGRTPLRGSLAPYRVAGLRVAVDRLQDPRANSLYSALPRLGQPSPLFGDAVRRYMLFLAAWHEVLAGRWDAADKFYQTLASDFPHASELSRIRQWIQITRNDT